MKGSLYKASISFISVLLHKIHWLKLNSGEMGIMLEKADKFCYLGNMVDAGGGGHSA